MKQDIEINEWIESFLNGNLPGNETMAFRKKMEEDPGFAREVELHRQIRDIITEGAYLHVKSELKTLHLQKIKLTHRIKRITGFGMGALIIGMLILLVIPDVRVSKKDTIESSPVAPVREDSNAATKLNSPLSEKASEVAGIKSSQALSGEPATVDQSIQIQTVHADTSGKTGIIRTEAADENQKLLTDKPVQEPVENFNSIAVNVAEGGKPDCRKIKIEGSFSESESCSNKPTGSIVIDRQSLTGGQAPYTFSMNQINFRDTLLFSGLYPGSYPLYAKDANDCVNRIGIALIRSVDCGIIYQAVFAPMKGEIWTVPADPDKEGILNIFSKTGTLVYSVRFSGSEPILWNGTTLSGQPLSMGIYPFEIRYSDGDNFTGNVTIVR